MSAIAEPAETAPPNYDRDNAACDEAIAACGGDVRATIKALLIANEFLEQALDEVQIAISAGYRRGRLAKPKAG